jgi:replicative DNA helicase
MNAPHDFPDRARLSAPPHSVEAEQSILGALLSDNDAIDRISTLKPDHFYRYDHRLIFQAISALVVSNRRADMITVHERLSTAGHANEVGGLPYLNSLVQNSPSSAGIARWAEIVIDRWRLRGVIAAADEISAMAYNRDARMTVNDIINEAQAKFEPLAEAASTDPKMIGEFLAPIVERIDQEFHGANARADAVPTGLTDLDAKLGGGMRGGQLIVVAGRPGMGKTAIALGVAEAVADAGKTSAFFSQEMVGDELCSRALSRASGLPLEKILDGRKFGRNDDHPDWPMLTRGVQRVSELNLIVDDRPALSLAAIRSAARKIKRRHGLGLIVVDYLGLMACTEGNNRNEQVGANSRGLKELAKELNVPVVLLAQLNRAVENRSDRRPLPSDLRDSGEIEQDADIILFLYRDEVYNPDSPDKGTAEINVAKQRSGPTGIVRAAYFGERTMFANLAPGYAVAPRPEPEKPKRGFR